MTCAEIIPKLELMADDELSSEHAAEILSHIDDCPGCRDHWYAVLALRQAVKDRAASFTPSSDFEERLINAVRKEAWKSKSGRGKKPVFLYAAAVVIAGIAAAVIFKSSLLFKSSQINQAAGNAPVAVLPRTAAQAPHMSAQAPLLSAQASATPAQAPDTLAQAPSEKSSPASLEDALSNFKQYLTRPVGAEVATANLSTLSTLSTLSKQAGFAIKPMTLSGFKLASAQIVSSAPGKTNFVRLSYTRTNAKGNDAIVCYQTAGGKLVAKGLNEHIIDGKKICCGEVQDKSVVFIPGQKDNANEVLLVGTISKSDLMDLVLTSS